MEGNKINKEDVQDILGLSATQKGILFHYLKDKEQKSYIEQLMFQAQGNISMTAFNEAWSIVLQQNAMLRTVFRWKMMSNPVQIVLKHKSFEACVRDIREQSNKEQSLSDIINEIRKTGFDLENETLRCEVVLTEENSFTIILSYHHIIMDGWSLGILLNELFTAYDRICDGEAGRITVKTEYKEFLRKLQMQDKKEMQTFWSQYLKLSESEIDLPHAENNQSEIMKEFAYPVKEDISDALRDAVSKYGVTLATVIYTAWGIVMQRLNNTDKVMFGTTVSGRENFYREFSNTVGMFINSPPLMVCVEENDTADSLLEKVAEDLEERKRYENSSLVEISDSLHESSGKSLFNTLIVIENYPITIPKVENKKYHFTVKDYSFYEMNNYELSLTFTLEPQLKIQFSYKSSYYNEKFVEYLGNYLEFVFQQITSSETVKIMDLPVCPEEDFISYKNYFYGEKKPLDGLSLCQRFKRQVKLYGSKPAVIFQDRTITYEELDVKTDIVAANILEKCKGEKWLIAVYMPRSIELIIALLGIVKAGCSYLPLDMEHPALRIQDMLDDSGAPMYITTSQLPESTYQNCERTVIETLMEDNRIPFQETAYDENALTYVIYTSGSTGKPKGVMIEQGALLNFVDGMGLAIEWKEANVVLSLTTVSFDIFGLELYVSLLNGLTMNLASREEQLEPKKAAEMIRKDGVDVIQMTPSRLSSFLTSQTFEESLKNLKYILVGGEAFPQELLVRLQKQKNQAKIYNVYGPTETTIWSTISDVTSKDKIDIGKPILNTDLFVLNKAGYIQPPYGIGELFISGSGLARGYMKKEELTAERFIYNEKYQEKMYGTGDLVRWYPDGVLECLGRVDNQVKVRGYRIELQEIEECLHKYKNLDAAVIVRKSEQSGENELFAFIVGEESLKDELFEYLRDYLPEYMIPSQLIFLDKLPLNLSGKVDRNALKNIEPEVREYQEDVVTETQKVMLELWREVLHRNNISIHDNFFNIGGNSMLLISLNGMVEKHFPNVLTMADYFTYTTISKLSDYIDKVNTTENTYQIKGITNPFVQRENEEPGTAVLEVKMNQDELVPFVESIQNNSLQLNSVIMSLLGYSIFDVFEQEELSMYAIWEKDTNVHEITIKMDDYDNLYEVCTGVYGAYAGETVIAGDCMRSVEEAKQVTILFVNSEAGRISDVLTLKFDVMVTFREEPSGYVISWENIHGKLSTTVIKKVLSMMTSILKNFDEFLFGE